MGVRSRYTPHLSKERKRYSYYLSHARFDWILTSSSLCTFPKIRGSSPLFRRPPPSAPQSFSSISNSVRLIEFRFAAACKPKHKHSRALVLSFKVLKKYITPCLYRMAAHSCTSICNTTPHTATSSMPFRVEAGKCQM